MAFIGLVGAAVFPQSLVDRQYATNTNRNARTRRIRTIRTIHFSIRFISRECLRLMEASDHVRKNYPARACVSSRSTDLSPLSKSQKLRINSNRAIGKSNHQSLTILLK